MTGRTEAGRRGIQICRKRVDGQCRACPYQDALLRGLAAGLVDSECS
jgi:hypothetical protein